MEALFIISFVAVMAVVGVVYFTYFDKEPQKEK